MIIQSEDRRLCVFTRETATVRRIQSEFSSDVLEKKSGPIGWFPDSKITQVAFGTLDTPEKQPYLHALLKKLKGGSGDTQKVSLGSADEDSVLVYNSESQTFRFLDSSKRNLIDFIESSFVSDQSESHETAANYKVISTRLNTHFLG